MNKLKLLLSLTCALLLAPSAFAEPSAFKVVTPGSHSLTYPRDHGAHKDFATEWWYFTGHLKTAAKARQLGFELTFFRVGVNTEKPNESAWAVDSLYLAHFALTDDSKNSFAYLERRSRGNFDEAGADDKTLHVWVKDWRAQLENGEIKLEGGTNNCSLSLSLASVKPLVLHGENGFSAKGELPGQASFYSSFTRLEGSGVLICDGVVEEVSSASVWMDQEFTSSELARGNSGWDWFALQLGDNTELMFYQLRQADGGISPFSQGTYVDSHGVSHPLSQEDFSVEVLQLWTSESSGITYPSEWRLRVPSLALDVTATPTVKQQELMTGDSTGVTYWEGRAKISGRKLNSPIDGNAYIELVGYSR